MSIRYRLLLIVGLVSSLIFLLAFFLNNQLLQSNIRKSREESSLFERNTIEKRKSDLEKLIRDDMAKKLAQINALLETVSQYPSLAEWFAPNSDNLRLGSWTHAAQFLQDEDWIQFLQNTSKSKLLSLIIPDQGPFFQTETVPLEVGLAWVFVPESTVYTQPYLGVELPFSNKEDKIEEESAVVISNSLPTVYALYTLDHLKSITFSPDFLQSRAQRELEPSMQGYEVDEDKFYEFLTRAIALAKNSDLKQPIKPAKQEAVLDEPLKLSEMYLKEILDYSNELFLIGEVTSLQQSRFFSEGSKGIQWPDAMSFSKRGEKEGKIFFLNTILGFSKPFFNDEAFFKENPPRSGSFVSSGGAIIKSPHPNQVFFANTAMICTGTGELKRESLLTIGFDMSDFLHDVVSVSGHYGCIISGNEVLTKLSPKDSSPLPYHLIPYEVNKIQESTGSISLGDTEYFFLKIQPDPLLDFYFCLILPQEEEFSLFIKMHEKINSIIHHVWIQKVILEFCSLLLLWILLLDLSKKITKPIISLSNCLRYVKTGEWDKVKIPVIKFNKHNEIRQLVNSFQDMVEGMKEKEKMNGILNMVVSKEIAQEILKGEVHLGGEERVVTMLFTDIRGFTQLTQNMDPHDVITLLNTCMTKLSQVIEENKGVIDKYLGDGIMALYGAPVAYKESPLCAVISGLEMIAIIQKWDEERINLGQVPLNIGIGIHTGTVCAGNMGAQNRLNYTVIGSHVNMASRLCFAAGPGELLISADTYLHPSVQQNVEVEDKGFMSFKGFDEKKQVYKVLRLKDPTIGKVLILQGNE